MRRFALSGLLQVAALFSAVQQRSILVLPGSLEELPSPDRSHMLYAVSRPAAPELWIEDLRTGQRTKLLVSGSTIEAEWSPDGNAFSVNDHEASDETWAYIYDTKTLKRLDIANQIQMADHSAKKFFADSHHYIRVAKWLDAERVLVEFNGHTDHAPVVCFQFEYRVSRAGAIQKLSERVSASPKAQFCRRSANRKEAGQETGLPADCRPHPVADPKRWTRRRVCTMSA